MGNRISASIVALAAFVSTLFATSASAADKRYNITTTGTGNWNITASWSGGLPTSADDASITNALSVVGTRVVTGAVAGTTVNFLRVGNDSGGIGTNKVIFQNTFTTSFGVIMSSQGIIEVWTNAVTFGINSFVTFDNRGTLALRTNALVILNAGGTKALTNAGTILFDNGGTAEFNYGQTLSFTNNMLVIKNGAGTGSFVGEFGGANREFINNGTVQANAGVLRFDPRDAFSGGFSNTSAGRIYIANNATVQVNRTTGAWNGGAVNANAGTISLFGGSFLAMDEGVGQNNGRTNNNSGVISGFGTLGFSFQNDGTGVLLATGGVLRVTGKIAGAGGSFTAGNATGAGTLNLQGGAVGAGATITGNVTATNSSAIVFSGDSDWTLSGTTKIGFTGATAAQRGSLISSNASGGNDTVFFNNAGLRDNQGTLSLVGGNGFNYGQIGAALTNNFVITGVGSLTGVVGASNLGVLNQGTISTVANSLLAIDPRDAQNLGGFQNAAAGTVVIASGSTLSFRRTDSAWFTLGSSPTNFGLITLANASSMIASNTDIGGGSVDGGKFVNAAGGIITITGTNNITNFRVLQNNGLITINQHALLTNTVNSTGSFDNSGGVVQLISGNGSLNLAGLVVSGGRYVSSSTSAITNSGGGGAQLKFTANTAQTNAGLIDIKINGTSSGALSFLMAVGTASNQFLINTGTMVFETTGSGTSAKRFDISNQFVNAGHLILTNTVSGGAAGRVDLRFTGSTTGASTNEAGGVISMVENAVGGAATANGGSVTFLNGGFVNLGNISINNVQAASPASSVFALSQAGATFSNAATGKVFIDVASVAGSTFDIRADSQVNAGSLILSNAGTVNLRNAANVASMILTNSGQILFGGGNLNSTNIYNTATGVMSGNGTFAGSAIRLVYNEGTIRASGGTLFLAMVTNINQAIVDAGAILRVQDLNNTGLVTSDTAGLVVRGDTINSGTISLLNSVGTFDGSTVNSGTMIFMNSAGTFSGSVQNSGAWISDPSTNVFLSTHTVTSSGYISAAAGDVYIFREDFVNQSAQNTTYDTMNTTPGASGAAGTKFIFDDDSANGTQRFYTAGLLLTGGFVGTPTPLVTGVQTVSSFAAVTGFIDNFAIDRLELGNALTNSTLNLIDTFNTASIDVDDGNVASLFVNDLWIFGTSQLILSNNVRLYFVNSNDWTSANFTLIGNAELHQLVLGVSAIPEPSVVLLWVSGLATVYAARRRANKNGKRS